MPTITLPDDLVTPSDYTKAFVTTDNAVYAGLPPGVVAGVDITGPPGGNIYAGVSDPQSAYTGSFGDAVGLHNVFLARNGARVASDTLAKMEPRWNLRTPPLAIGSADYNTIYRYATGDPIGFFGKFYRPDLDGFPYTVTLLFNANTGKTTPLGDYVFYSVYVNYNYDTTNYNTGGGIGTFPGYVYRKFAFTLAAPDNGGGGNPTPDPTPSGCHCHYAHEAAPVCNYHGEATLTTPYTRPAC